MAVKVADCPELTVVVPGVTTVEVAMVASVAVTVSVPLVSSAGRVAA